MEHLFEIVHEDEALLVLNKPAGLVCHPTKGDVYSSLISRARLYLGERARPQLVNRLDRETSGLMLVAKTEVAARQLRGIWENRDVQKEYLAIVHGHVRPDGGEIEAPLGREEHSCVAIKDCVREDGALARTRVHVVTRFAREEGLFTLVQVFPLTGRKHQIRIHLAHIGHAIVGDKLYGGDEKLYLDFVEGRLTDEQRRRLLLRNHALHSGAVRFRWRGRDWAFRAECEPEFKAFVDGVGGAFADLNCAEVNTVSCGR